MQKEDPRNICCNQRKSFEQQDADQASQSNGTSQKSYDERLAEMKSLAEKYQREGEGQLVKDIINSVLEQKAAGNLSNEQLQTFAKRVSPLLNSEQRQRLNGLLEQLLQL